MIPKNDGSPKPNKRLPPSALNLPIKRLRASPGRSNLNQQLWYSPSHKNAPKTITFDNSDKMNKRQASPILTSSGGIKLPIKPSKFVLHSIRPSTQKNAASIESKANKNKNTKYVINDSVLSKTGQRSKTPDLKIKKQTLGKSNNSKNDNLSNAPTKTGDSTTIYSTDKSLGVESHNFNISNDNRDEFLSVKLNLNDKKADSGFKDKENGSFNPEETNANSGTQQKELFKPNKQNTLNIEIKRKTLKKGNGKHSGNIS